MSLLKSAKVDRVEDITVQDQLFCRKLTGANGFQEPDEWPDLAVITAQVGIRNHKGIKHNHLGDGEIPYFEL
jgi:hypothetical protein